MVEEVASVAVVAAEATSEVEATSEEVVVPQEVTLGEAVAAVAASPPEAEASDHATNSRRQARAMPHELIKANYVQSGDFAYR